MCSVKNMYLSLGFYGILDFNQESKLRAPFQTLYTGEDLPTFLGYRGVPLLYLLDSWENYGILFYP